MERSGPIKIRKTEISRPLIVENQNLFYPQNLRQKIRLKKLAKKKFDLRPRSFLMSKVKILGLTKDTFLKNP